MTITYSGRLLPSVLLTAGWIAVSAQGKKEDYQRADLVKSAMDTKVFYAPKSFNWNGGNDWFWYTQNTPEGLRYVVAGVENIEKKEAFDHKKLAEALSVATRKAVRADSLPLTGVRFYGLDKAMDFVALGTKWRYQIRDNKLESRGEPEVENSAGRYWGDRYDEKDYREIVSPDGEWVAYVKDYNVCIKSVNDPSNEIRMSWDGSEGNYFSSNIVWSPDSEKLAVYKIRPGQKRLMYLIESTPSTQFQPKLHTRDYLKPGDALPQKQPYLFSVKLANGAPVATSMNEQFAVSGIRWWRDSRAFTFEYNERGHQAYKVIEVDGITGKARDLISEESKTFIDYSGKKFRQDIDDGKEVIWASERDGWNHLYLIDGVTGNVKNRITAGNWVIRRVVKADERSRTILFEAGGIIPGQDPYLVQYAVVNFDGSGLRLLTTENGTHSATFSPDFKYFVDTWSRVDLPQTTVLKRTSDGKIIKELEKTDISELTKINWREPEVFSAKGRDGVTDIWGVIIRPTNFSPKRKYPVIELIYAGPHSAHAPKTFNSDFRYRFLHELAELGFVVVQLDGMGTSQRSKAFHDVTWRNLKDAGFEDRIRWMKAAASRYPYMDLTRVGIFGNSAGGQNSAGALLFHPEFYKVAVSSSGCHDNRMDKIWWNEQWMGYPVGPEYAESSNSTHAHKLKGKLLLILGEIDDNVDPASTMQFMDALIKANKKFDFLMVPGMGHSMGGDYGEHKRRDFFVKHLLGVEPPAWDGQDW